jgi:hypothetical protein
MRTCHNGLMGENVTTVTPLIDLLDRLWAAVQSEHPDVPPVVISLGTTQAVRGHLITLDTARWSGPGTDELPELAVASTALDADAETLLAAILHAAAHGMGEARGITTTSRQGRYHNARFADLARETGLTVEQTAAAGWVDTRLAVGTAVRYATELREMRQLLARFPARKETSRTARTGRVSSNNPVPARCGCNPVRRIRVSASVMVLGPIICSICSQAFEV